MAQSWQLGGENSGHIICLDKHTTGDAIVSALQVLRALIEQRHDARRSRERPWSLFPQRLINVPVQRGFDWTRSARYATRTRAATAALGDAGRVLLRPSGTEPVLRVMVEARDAALADAHARTIAASVAAAVG